MNVYDFDETIYHGDSTRDFVIYLMKKHPKLWCYWFDTLKAFYRWKRGYISKKAFKETLYRMFRGVPDMQGAVESFWDEKLPLIKHYYLQRQRPDDLVVSASPAFLLQPCCERLGIRHLLASPVDIKSGRYDGPNCWGNEKVRRCHVAGYDLRDSEAFYSDSYADSPLAQWADHAYLVQGERLAYWGSERPAYLERLWHRLRHVWR